MSPESRIVETHVSTLMFVDDLVYKRKKAVHTGFLDFTEPAARLTACRREVELNRRLSPDVYLGVADLTLDGLDLDHFVVMRRLPEQRRLSARLDAASIDDDLRSLAHQIAAFHASAQRSPEIDAAARPEALLGLWTDGIAQLAPFTPELLDPAEVERALVLAREYLEGRRRLLDDRVDAQRICDGHGDLIADDVFILDDGPRVLDCIEFDDRLRYGDVLSDVAFLAMDLERLGRADLGARFLDEYREFTADAWPASLAHHYLAYRAHIRAKVACIRHGQDHDADAARAAAALHRQCVSHLESARVWLSIVGGSPGTGKTSLARGLAERTGAVLLSSDAVRDELFPERCEPKRNHRVGSLRAAASRRGLRGDGAPGGGAARARLSRRARRVMARPGAPRHRQGPDPTYHEPVARASLRLPARDGHGAGRRPARPGHRRVGGDTRCRTITRGHRAAVARGRHRRHQRGSRLGHRACVLGRRDLLSVSVPTGRRVGAQIDRA